MEDAHQKIEEAIVTKKQMDVDKELQRSAEWASVIISDVPAVAWPESSSFGLAWA